MSPFSSQRDTLPRVIRAALLTALALAMAAAAPAFAQWAWKDGSGRMVYSDNPPPSSVKQGQIVHQPTTLVPLTTPGGPGDAAAPAPGGDAVKEAKFGPAAAANAAPAATVGPKTIADQELEFRKRRQEQEQAEKKQAEQLARSSQQAQECERTRGYIRSLESGMRISRTTSEGSREFLDDTQRAGELERARNQAAHLCQQ